MKKNKLAAIALSAMIAAAPFTAFAEDTAKEISPISISAPETIVGVPQITVNGDAIDFSRSGLSQYIFDVSENVMVPVRAVAEKMGFSVGWDSENQAVTVGNDVWEVRAYIGQDLYSGVTKIEGAVGMTSPQSYGAAPLLFENTTFVPAKMFELMDYKCHAVGQFVDFSKDNTIIEEDGYEYSSDTLIIAVSPDTNDADIEAFFAANEMKIIYKMKNFNMYTVQLKAPMTADELNKYIAELESNEDILSVNKNYIIQLDDPM